MKNRNSTSLGLNYWLFIVGRFVHGFCSGTMLFGMSVWIIQSMEKGAAKAAFFMAPSLILAIFLPPLLAPIADRVCKRKIMLVSDFLSIFPLTILFICAYTEIISYISLCLLFWLYSSVRSLFNSASNSLLPQLVRMDQLGQAQVFLQATGSGMIVFSGLMGAYLASVLPLWQLIAIALVGLSVSFSAVYLIRIKEDTNINAKPNQTLGIKIWWEDLLDGWHYIQRESGIWQLVWMLALINFIIGPLGYLIEVYVLRDLNLSARELGYTVCCTALGFLISTWVYHKAESYFTSWKKIVLFFSLMSPAFFISGFFVSIWVLMFSCIIFGALFTLINVPINVRIMSAIDPQYRARILNLVGFFAGVTQPIALFIYGGVLELVSVASVFLFISTLILASFTLLKGNQALHNFMLEKAN